MKKDEIENNPHLQCLKMNIDIDKKKNDKKYTKKKQNNMFPSFLERCVSFCGRMWLCL